MNRAGALGLSAVALLASGCGVDPSGPTPIASAARVSLSASPLADSEAIPAESLPTLRPPRKRDPEGVPLSCGSPLAFGAHALRGPAGVELADHPAAAALRQLVTDGHLPTGNGWRLVVLTDSSALFLLPMPADEEFPYLSAEFESRDGTWTWVRYGQCVMRPVFDGIEPARWELAPGQQLTRDVRTFEVLVTEQACASGQSPEGRIMPAAAIYLETSIIVIFGVRPLPGAQTCQGNPSLMVTLELDEPLGDRALLDGSALPAEPRGGPP